MKWEYRVIDMATMGATRGGRMGQAKETLDRLGSDGWELVAASDQFLFFKRPAA